ncbi:acyl-CoA dehydrogenase family protein [Sphaerimonospora thailandensis]|uniref:Hydroxylase n=1 Tax=Sphaerimonospora thailandensis TaxID=795644 RepID=A0A8J3W1R4_9ACTN|nr:acyl-CoA dehydrogenase family protein [Sphaerimonospora thailandensis]GIH72485.1 hydroxylase [Sphaerimonospora thailandensis]
MTVELSSSTVPNSFADILEAARRVAPRLRERADDIEKHRCLPADVVELLRGTGVFRMAVPRSWGGPELNSTEQTQVIEALAMGDASAGWCAMIGMDTPIYAGYLEESVARELFTDPDLITAGLILPVGRADRVPGGYRVTGRWGFGSGITHADWVVAGCQVYSDGEPERGPGGMPVNWRVMLARRDDFEILDTWHTTGLAGSGSRDYTANQLFVPEERSFSLARPRREGPLFATDSVLRNMPGVPLGIARAALDLVREMAGTRVERATGLPWTDTYRVQMAIAEAEMELGAVRYAVYGSLDRLWDRLASGVEPAPDERAAAVLARTNSFRVARSIVTRMVDLVATAAIYRPSPLDRWLRDLTTMCQHVIAQDQVIQSAGAHLLGGVPQNPFSLGLLP